MPLKVHVTFEKAFADQVTGYYNDLIAGFKGGQMPEVEITVQAGLVSPPDIDPIRVMQNEQMRNAAAWAAR